MAAQHTSGAGRVPCVARPAATQPLRGFAGDARER